MLLSTSGCRCSPSLSHLVKPRALTADGMHPRALTQIYSSGPEHLCKVLRTLPLSFLFRRICDARVDVNGFVFSWTTRRSLLFCLRTLVAIPSPIDRQAFSSLDLVHDSAPSGSLQAAPAGPALIRDLSLKSRISDSAMCSFAVATVAARPSYCIVNS